MKAVWLWISIGGLQLLTNAKCFTLTLGYSIFLSIDFSHFSLVTPYTFWSIKKLPKSKFYQILGRLSFEKKKVVNFHNFGPDPPPKSCENPIFFLLHDPKIIMCKLRKILPWEAKIVARKKYLVENYPSFQSILVRGYPYPLQKKFLLQIWMN